MSKITDIIVAGAALASVPVSIAGVWLIYGELQAATQQERAIWDQAVVRINNDRAANATRALLDWSIHTQNSAGITDFLQSLTVDQAEKIDSLKPFTATDEQIGFVYEILRKDYPDAGESIVRDSKLVDQKYINLIRSAAIKHMNILEGVLSCWRHNTCNKKIIEEQFRYLRNDRRSDIAYTHFRSVVGTLNYPSITEYSTYLIGLNKGEQPVAPAEDQPPTGATSGDVQKFAR